MSSFGLYSLNCIISTKNATFYYVKIKNNHQEGKWKKIVHFGKSQGLIRHFNGGYLIPLLPQNGPIPNAELGASVKKWLTFLPNYPRPCTAHVLDTQCTVVGNFFTFSFTPFFSIKQDSYYNQILIEIFPDGNWVTFIQFRYLSLFQGL